MLSMRRIRWPCRVFLDLFTHKIIKIEATSSFHVIIIIIVVVLSETIAGIRPLSAVVRVKTYVVCDTIA